MEIVEKAVVVDHGRSSMPAAIAQTQSQTPKHPKKDVHWVDVSKKRARRTSLRAVTVAGHDDDDVQWRLGHGSAPIDPSKDVIR